MQVAAKTYFDCTASIRLETTNWKKNITVRLIYLQQAPNSLYNALTHLSETYGYPDIYITENGWSTSPDAGLIDNDRISYIRASLESALDALDAGVKLKGYLAWSLMDTFEWMQGYT